VKLVLVFGLFCLLLGLGMDSLLFAAALFLAPWQVKEPKRFIPNVQSKVYEV
jgi:hypothetical protein